MFRIFLNHGFKYITHIHIFKNGLQQQPKLLLDASAWGFLMSKSTEDAIVITGRMTLNDNQRKYKKNF